jgi:plastocyanin
MVRPALLLALVLFASAAAPPTTGRIEGTVKVTRDGKTVDASGVIVYLTGFDEPAPKASASIRQKNKTFTPDLLPITVGQLVSFPNDDAFYHNVFSTSKARKFDLGQYEQGTAKTKAFPQVGVVDLYCNIHPQMAATILVLPNRRFMRASADGSFVLDGVPEGTWPIYAFSRRAEKPVKGTVTVAASQPARIELNLDETRDGFPHKNKYGEPYDERDYSK